MESVFILSMVTVVLISPLLLTFINRRSALGEYLEVDQRIVDAKPTDGLWDDSRTDEEQLGASYEELEEAMETGKGSGLEVLQKFNTQNKHKNGSHTNI